jgi:perosamine synthetase
MITKQYNNEGEDASPYLFSTRGELMVIVPQARPEMDQEMIDAALSALQNERLVMGESVFKFEEAFARYIGVKRAISVSSGTDALILALLALDCQGKEVVTTPFSFVATANSIIHAHGNPVFSDVDGRDFNLDVKRISGSIGEHTAALMPVHLFGCPCDMGELNDLAEEKGLFIVEDACQAHGATYKGKKVGSLGDLGCFSFYPTKNMTVGGDGGMVTTDDCDLADMVAKLRDCGRISRYLHDTLGFTSRLNNVNAALGLIQLKRLDEWNDRRREIARRYSSNLRDVEGILTPLADKNEKMQVYHQYVIQTNNREGLSKRLDSLGVSTAVHYPIPIHLQPVYREKYGYREGCFPVSESLSGVVLSLPIFPSLSDDEVDFVSEGIKTFFN